jgi:hypothetical protein
MACPITLSRVTANPSTNLPTPVMASRLLSKKFADSEGNRRGDVEEEAEKEEGGGGCGGGCGGG